MSDLLSLAELARAAGVPARTLRYYLERELLPAAEFKAKNTRYSPALIPRIAAITALRVRGLKADAIKRKLATMSAEEVTGMAQPSSAAPATRPLPEGMIGPYRAGLGQPSERWEHVTLCPGVVLTVHGEADSEAWRVAREVVAMFGGQRAEVR